MRSETAALWAGFRKTVLLIGAIDIIIIIVDVKGTYNPVLILTTIIITTIMMVVITTITIIITNNMMMVTIVIIVTTTQSRADPKLISTTGLHKLPALL